MRSLIIALTSVLFATHALAQSTTPSGLGIRQNGAPVALVQDGERFVARLAPAPFTLTYPDGPKADLAILFGTWEGFDQFDPPVDMNSDPFHFALTYAGEDRPNAALFLTDRLCAEDDFLPGHNLLRAGAWTEAGFPVTELRVDGVSRECEAAGRLPADTNLLRVLSPIYAMVQTPLGVERLVLQFRAQ